MIKSTQLPGWRSARNIIAALLIGLVTTGCPKDNRSPVLSGFPVEVNMKAGESLQVQPYADDADGDSLAFEIENQPSWTTFDENDGALTGTPDEGDVGTYDKIRISVTDGKALVQGPAFRVVVESQPVSTTPPPPEEPPPPVEPPPPEEPPPPPPPNSPPQISGTPVTAVTEGQAYSFQPSASDPDGQTLVFSIENKPAWVAFSSTSGQIAGTPAAADVGVHTGIVISVSDGSATVSLPSFEITVAAANRAPTIGGTPTASVVEGQAYSFTPIASDPNGDPLTFSISNKPAWASFNTASGTLSGTPGAGTAGTYANIVITVSDGPTSASLAAFGITVQQAANGSATLSWSPPTARTDGSQLSNLAGYKVYYGTSSGSYPNMIRIDNPGLTTYVVENLAPATYYFVMTAFDDVGSESAQTGVVSKKIND